MDCFRKYTVEFIGTFFLVFTVCSAVLFAMNGVIPAIAIGFILMVMVYAGAHISGGHYNPAVSLACAIRGALCFKDLIPYWIAQILGAIIATYTVLAFVPEGFVLTECPYGKIAIIAGEFLFTFALCYVVLNAATSEDTEDNSFYGLAIGSTVTAGIFAVGGILCYGAFNPAVALSLGLTNVVCWGIVGVTALSNLVAGIAAAFVFKFTSKE